MNIVGRLTENAQVQTLSNGKQVVNFSVAVNDNYRNKAGEGEPQAGLNFHTSKIKFHFSKKAEVTPNTSASEANNANAITPLSKSQVTAEQVAEEDEDDLPF